MVQGKEEAATANCNKHGFYMLFAMSSHFLPKQYYRVDLWLTVYQGDMNQMYILVSQPLDAIHSRNSI